MKILLLTVLVAFAAASPFDKCSYGESYWCSGLKQAKECGAFKHCLTTIWQHHSPPKAGGEVCQFCETIIKEVRGYITDQKSQEQIKGYLDSACTVIPDKSLASECKTMVDNYLPEVLDLISSELDPKTVCSVMRLCPGFKDLVQHIQQDAPLLFMPHIYVPQGKAEPICTDCKKFMQDIKTMATSQASEKQIETMIEQQLCSQLGSFASECNQLVEMYVPEIMQLLTAEFDPNQICQMMQFCNATGSTPKAMLAKLRLRKSPLFMQASKLTGVEECVMCKTALGEIQTLSKDKAVQSEVEFYLKTIVCAQMGSLKDACDSSVMQYAPELFELIAEELDPATRCQSLGFCTALNKNKISENATPQLVHTPKKVKASPQCVMCEFVMREIDGMLTNNATEKEIIAALDKVCSILPSTISDECKGFVDQYGPAVIILLSEELSPALVCSTLGLCSSKIKTVVKIADTELCGVCETLIQYVDALMEQNSTVKEVEAILNKVCNFLPEQIRTECNGMVEEYGPAIIQLIAQFADPKEVCTTLGVCQTEALIVPVKAQLVGTKECTYGPSYWCANKDNAEKCGATEHCIKHGWMKN